VKHTAIMPFGYSWCIVGCNQGSIVALLLNAIALVKSQDVLCCDLFIPCNAVSTTQTAAAAAAIEAAGAIAAEGADAAGSAFGDGPGQQWEVFFSRPAASMPALFKAVAAQAAAVQ
jgi:hypothetical protein